MKNMTGLIKARRVSQGWPEDAHTHTHQSIYNVNMLVDRPCYIPSRSHYPRLETKSAQTRIQLNKRSLFYATIWTEKKNHRILI